MIYLDSAAATRALPCAIETMKQICSVPANPNSSHVIGQDARATLDAATAKIKHLIGANSGTVHYFPTATAAAQNAIYSLTAAGYGVCRYDTEHHSVLAPTFIEQETSKHRGTNGIAYCRMLSNNETGETFESLRLDKGQYWVCDATAAMGHIPVNVKKLGCHYLIGDALKFGGVPGCAFVWVSDGAPFTPLVEGGTPSVGLICAMAAALEWHVEHMAENTEHIKALREIFVKSFQKACLDYGNYGLVNGDWESSERQLPHILNVSFEGVDGKALALMCSKRGVMVSAGAACTSGNNEPSHVLMAMFHDEQRARSAIRISLSHENTPEECEQAAKIIAECVKTLREIG